MTEDGTRFDVTTETYRDEDLLDAIHDHELPGVLNDLLEDYLALDGARPLFMWKWVHRLAPQNTLPCVDDAYVDAVAVDKTITILFVTLLDDVLEKRRDPATFNAIATIPFERLMAANDSVAVDAEYVEVTERIWETLLERIQRGPMYDRYADILRFDVKQVINAIEYSHLVTTHPELATMADLRRYESHNMAMFVYADIDLMHSPPEHVQDFGRLRDAIGTAQRMARIGNWVSTWRRELREGDYSTGVLVHALEEGILEAADLPDAEQSDTAADEIIDQLEDAGVEQEFLDRWQDHRRELEDYNETITTMDLTPFIEGTEEVLRYHLASTGLK